MRWIGTGSELWRVRVDIFVPDDGAKWTRFAFEGLRNLLIDGDAASGDGDAGSDQGTGIAGRPVVGLLFWVRADDVGQAALRAVDTAARALADHLAKPELYDVTVIPRTAVAMKGDSTYPVMPD